MQWLRNMSGHDLFEEHQVVRWGKGREYWWAIAKRETGVVGAGLCHKRF